MSKEHQKNGWAHGFFDCCSPAGLCLKTFFCPCITFGKAAHLTNHNNLDDYSCCNGSNEKEVEQRESLLRGSSQGYQPNGGMVYQQGN
ncbi:hypothetical protein MKX08_008828 [Trichoderma sp. CBMAI-0020]|nr:hypothetical protein MKX08_008828 [Trichoderma sp. CBMAI-0020]